MAQHIQRILLATDFSACSESALEYALIWARTCDAELDCIHVTELHPHLDVDGAIIQTYLEEQRRQAKPLLDGVVKQAQVSHLRTKGHECIGIPEQEICKFALDHGSDLIVVGTHGWSGLNRILLGSVAERVVCHAPCPVMSVRPSGTEPGESTAGKTKKTEAPSAPTHILIPLDFSDCSLDAVELAAEVAKDFDIKTTLLYVREPYGYSLDFRLDLQEDQRIYDEQVKKQLEKLKQTFEAKGISASTLLKTYPIAQAVIQSAQEIQADLIVMGTHGRSGVSRLLMGSETSKVLRQAPVPVLTVKLGKYDHDHPRRQHHPSQTTSTS